MPIATKLGMLVIYHKRLLPIKSHDPLIIWWCKITWQTKTCLHYHGACGHQTWRDGNLSWWYLTHIITWHFDHLVLEDHVTNENHCITITTVPMATKLGRMVTYLERFQHIKLHNPLTMWPCKITWQTKNIISLLTNCLWPPKLAEWWLTLRGSFPYGHMTLNKVVFVVDFCDNLTNYISTFTRFMATKIGSVVTLRKGFNTQTIKLSPTFCFNLICFVILY